MLKPILKIVLDVYSFAAGHCVLTFRPACIKKQSASQECYEKSACFNQYDDAGCQ